MSGRSKTDSRGLKEAARKFPLISCDVCGGTETLQRHHMDGDRTNNDETNVEILCQTCHKDAHVANGTWGRPRHLEDKACPICKRIFRPRRSITKTCGDKRCLREVGRANANKRWSRESRTA